MSLPNIPAIMPITTTAIDVSDIEESKEFYIENLGLECKRETVDSENRTHCYIGGEWETEIELIAGEGNEASDNSFGTVINEDGSQDLVVPKLHISIVIQRDMDKIFNSICDHPECEVIQEPVVERFDGGSTHIAFITDPDGYPIELNRRTGENHPLPK
jgi:catechol 2,3-dioxygenase-like lactoylglutathione lyase family enzyme